MKERFRLKNKSERIIRTWTADGILVVETNKAVYTEKIGK